MLNFLSQLIIINSSQLVMNKYQDDTIKGKDTLIVSSFSVYSNYFPKHTLSPSILTASFIG